MSLIKKIASFTRDLVVLFILVALFALSVLGTKTSPQKSIAFGQYQIGVFDSGFAIYASGRKTPYWSVSVLNDYILTSDGKKEILLSGREFEEGRYESISKKEGKEDLLESLQYFYGKDSLDYSVKKVGLEASYKAFLDGNTLRVERQILPFNPNGIVATGMTLGFSGDDLVYDPTTNTFIFYTDKADVEFFSRFIEGPVNLHTYKEGEYLVDVPSGKVVLVNKFLPGALLIEAAPGQRLMVDVNYGVILTEQQVDDPTRIDSKIIIKVFDSAKEVRI